MPYANGRIVKREFDAVGNVTKELDALDRGVEAGYDLLGRPEWVRDGVGNEARFFFDAASRLRYTQSPKGLWAEYRYDELNRLVEYEDEDANLTCYEYDENDNVVGVVSPLAMIWTGPFPPWLWGYGGGAGRIWQSRYRRTGGGGLAGSRRAGPVDGKERRNKRT